MSQTSNAIIFDFDGVIADTYTMWYKVAERFCADEGINLTEEMFDTAFDGNPWDYWMKTLNKDKETIKEVMAKTKMGVSDKLAACSLFPQMDSIIQQLAQDNDLFIISSTPAEALLPYLKQKGLHIYFKQVLGPEAGFTKTERIEKVKQDYSNITFISDTAGDIREGNAAKVTTIAVTWGWHSEEKLKAARPNHIAHNKEELQRLLNTHIS